MRGHPVCHLMIPLAFMLVGCRPSESPPPAANDVEQTAGREFDSDTSTTATRMTVTVATNTAWQASGINVEDGQTVTLVANGQYTFHSAGYQSGPEGIPDAESFLGSWPANDLVGLSLIGKIGETGPAFFVGAGMQLEIKQPGELYFMVNDDILDENTGVLEVQAQLSGPSEGVADAGDVSEAGVLVLPEVGFRMEIPASWQQGGFSGETVLASYTGGSGLYPELNVVLEDHAGRDLQQMLDSLPALLSSPVVRSTEALSVSGHPALRSDVSWSSVLGELRALRLFVSLGDRVLMVTFVDRAADWSAESASEFRDDLRTLSLAPAQ